MKTIPVIDLFAGPGGLCEGFSRPLGGGHPFRPVLSIEKDATAHRTLELRAFVHWFMFRDEPLPEEYYRYVRKEIEREDLFAKSSEAAEYAKRTAWMATLGGEEFSEEEFDRRIKQALDGEKNWVLIGGPPCQAYSLAGRSRSVGGYRKKGHLSLEKALAKFGKDERQTLYKQYLRILAVHKPAVFVMENVAGILSAKVNGESIFPKIVDDLSRPISSAREDWPGLKGDDRRRYRIFSFETGCKPACDHLEDYLIRAERHGVPQARHRVILLGIRSDFAKRLNRIRSLSSSEGVGVQSAIGDLPKMRSRISKGAEDTDEAWNVFLRQWASKAVGGNEFDVVRKAAATAVVDQKAWLFGKRKGRWNPASMAPAALKEWYVDAQLPDPLNHLPRGHMADDLTRYLFVSAFGYVNGKSPVLRDFPAELLPKHRNVKLPGAKGDQAFADRFKVQLRDKPASTVTCHIAKDGHYFIHYDISQCRSLTVREAARLQTFPDNYFFEGNQTEQYHQVGNAVPPFLAAQLADVVAGVFRREKRKTKNSQRRQPRQGQNRGIDPSAELS